jgi:hypothetical protein
VGNERDGLVLYVGKDPTLRQGHSFNRIEPRRKSGPRANVFLSGEEEVWNYKSDGGKFWGIGEQPV